MFWVKHNIKIYAYYQYIIIKNKDGSWVLFLAQKHKICVSSVFLKAKFQDCVEEVNLLIALIYQGFKTDKVCVFRLIDFEIKKDTICVSFQNRVVVKY